LNSDDQIVIAGEAAAVDEALGLLAGARSVKLPVSAPFLTSLMKPAEDRLAADLDAVEFRDPRFPSSQSRPARAAGGEWKAEAPGRPDALDPPREIGTG
jgi:[acyl-carrier-protein] S-malonyltransferase